MPPRNRLIPLRERLQRDEFPITYEAVSPRTGAAGPHVEAFAQLPCLPLLAGVNLTNNPSARVRIDPAMYGHLLQEATGVETVAHITCRDDTLAGIQRWLLGAWALGIRNVSVMTGDHPKEGDYPEERRVDSVNALELIAGIRRHIAVGELMPDVMQPAAARYANRFAPPKPTKKTDPMDFFVGAPIIPWRNNEDGYAKAKLEAGAQFLQTQITWDAKPVLDFVERLEQQKVLGRAGRFDVPILVGASPLKTLRTMEFMHTSIPFVKVPEPVQKRMREASDPGAESVAICLEMYADLRDGARARGLVTKLGAHVLPINDDRLGNAIVEGVAKL